MAHSLAELRKSRASNFAKLNDELSKINSSQHKADERFWQPTVDKAKNGYAVIRFLPAPRGEDVPFVRRWDHGFKGPNGKWYIELSRTSIGEEDPVAALNSTLWNSTTDDDAPARKQARKQKRRLHYISNVLVVEDPANPENNGKVFLFKYGKKIFDKLNDLMNPKFPDEVPVNPFDFDEGANFKIKIRDVEGFRNYDKSEFDKPSPISTDDAKLQAIWESEHSLQDFLDPKHYKGYEELEKKLNQVLGIGGGSTRAQDEDDRPARAEAPAQRAAQAPSAPAKEAEQAPSSGPDDEDEDGEGLAFFNRLAQRD